MIVLDASAAVDLLLPNRRRGERVADQIRDEHTIHVPALFDLEVLQALRRLELSPGIPRASLTAALADLADLRASRHDHELLRPRIWALRHNLTAYDAAYVALAELLGARLLTTDAALARSARHEARIELVTT